jgi:CBS domain containing-hemolysin-like protein
MDYTVIVVILCSLIASAFFSGTEMAFVSSNKLKIELDRQKGYISGKILSSFVKNDSRFIATMLLGNNIALVVYGIWMAKFIEPFLIIITPNTAFVLTVQTLFSTLLILFTAEFLPKATFQINPNRVLQALSIPLTIIYALLFPLTLFTMFLSKSMLRLFNVQTENGRGAFSKVDLDDYVRDLNNRIEEGGKTIELDNEMQILQNALAFSEIKARDCMIPRTDMVALEIEEPIEDLKSKFIETGLSKILIYRESIDNIIGYVHSFELFKNPTQIKEVLLPVSFVPESIFAKELLEKFAKQQGNLAIVLDEYGGTSGLVTIEDVVEEIFGDIEDEHDNDQLFEKEIDKNIYHFSGRQDIDYLNDEYSLKLPESTEYETLGGLILNYTETIPDEGTTIKVGSYRISVLEVSDRKIEVVKIERLDD